MITEYFNVIYKTKIRDSHGYDTEKDGNEFIIILQYKAKILALYK